VPRLFPLPWWVLYELATAARGEWAELPAGDRAKLRKLLSKSRGVPTNLSARERAEVSRILSRVDVKRVVRQMLPKAAARRLRRG